MPLFQRFQKMIKTVFRIMKSHLCGRPCMILKRLDETVADAILSYYILYHYFKISKIYQKFMGPLNQAHALMLTYYRRDPHNFKTIEWKL